MSREPLAAIHEDPGWCGARSGVEVAYASRTQQAHREAAWQHYDAAHGEWLPVRRDAEHADGAVTRAPRATLGCQNPEGRYLMSREVPGLAGRTAVASVSGAVVLAHGGRSVSTDPVTRVQPAVLRMVPFARAIRHAMRGSRVAVYRPRFGLRGWNGELQSPVADLREVLDCIGTRFGPVPVVLVGHSMGARAALRTAGHPLVAAVAGLAPWLPSSEPVDQLAGRRILLAHGTADRVTRPADTWAYAERARLVTEVAAIEVQGGDHALLRRAPLWHRLATDFCRVSFGLHSTGAVTVAFRRAAGNQDRPVL